MLPLHDHPWDLDAAQMAAVQRALAPQVIQHDALPAPVRVIAGVDVAYPATGDRVFGGISLLDADTHEILEEISVSMPDRVPYVPGLLSFRELPPLLACFARLSLRPDLVVCDGQGLAHPARFGLACHLGVLFDVPTIGCAKSRLLGEHDPLPGPRGSRVDLHLDGAVVGAVLRTQADTRPMYVSIGHRVSLPTAIEHVLRLCATYRQPETTRAADQLVRRVARGEQAPDAVLD